MSNWFKSHLLNPRAKAIFNFIKLLRIEPFMFMMIFQYGFKGMPNFQIIQDKICMQWYNTTYDYCHNLPSIHEEDSGPGHFKNRILADTIQMTTYVTYVELLPSLIWGLFVGAWIDRFNKGRKWLLILFVLAGMIENMISIYLTVNFGASAYINVFMTVPTLLLAGGGTGPRIAVTHYMTATTPPKYMTIRFMLFEISLTLALPIGSALAGYVVVLDPAFQTGQVRNFTVIYIISLVLDVVGLLWVIFMVKESVARQQQINVENELQEKCGNDTKAFIKSTDSEHDSNVHPLKLLFNLENAKSMIRVILKKRPNKGRKQILLIILALSIIFGEQIALTSLNSQFIQRVYLWNPDYTAYMSAIGMVIASIASMTIVPLMTRVFNVWDITLAIVGYFINFTTNLIKGLWLSENAYFLTMAVGAIGGLAAICTRSHVAKIVDRNEQGKMMGVMAMMDTISPVVATTIFSQIFKHTVNTYPGTVYQVIAAIIVIPISIMFWIFLRTERQIVDGVNNKEPNVGATDELKE